MVYTILYYYVIYIEIAKKNKNYIKIINEMVGNALSYSVIFDDIVHVFITAT